MSEKALLIGIRRYKETPAEAKSSFEELRALAYTAGATVVQEVHQVLKRFHPKYFIGTGKVEEIVKSLEERPVDLVIIDHDLSPSQQQGLEEALDVKVVDRTGIILDIFAKRARSKEGKLQVELAQLNYLLPRLKGQGVVLSRLGGGIGTRGPGETKLEVDRRHIRDRIALLKGEIKQLEKNRTMHRRKRQGVPIPIVTLVGYTNSGKSTLLNQLTQSDVLVEDKLFATLDPTTRRISLPNKQTVLLTDTVGFIKKLPTQLVKAFKATLEEVVESDLLLHVMDLSHPEFERQQEEVTNILESLGVRKKLMLYVYNKIDASPDPRIIFLKQKRHHPFVMISASKKKNFDQLLDKIQELLTSFVEIIDLKIPMADQKTLAQIHASGLVLEKKYFSKSVRIKAQVPHKLASQLKKRYA